MSINAKISYVKLTEGKIDIVQVGLIAFVSRRVKLSGLVKSNIFH